VERKKAKEEKRKEKLYEWDNKRLNLSFENM
jgi:hypothetical protein